MRSIAAEVAATQTDGVFESIGGKPAEGGGEEEGEKKTTGELICCRLAAEMKVSEAARSSGCP